MGKTIVLVTHEDDIAGYCKRIVRFKDGNIVNDSFNKPVYSLKEGNDRFFINL